VLNPSVNFTRKRTAPLWHALPFPLFIRLHRQVPDSLPKVQRYYLPQLRDWLVQHSKILLPISDCVSDLRISNVQELFRLPSTALRKCGHVSVAIVGLKFPSGGSYNLRIMKPIKFVSRTYFRCGIEVRLVT